MKKTLITILIILILVGVGYFVFFNRNKICTTDAPMAKNIKTGEIRGFSNGCLPRGWERVSPDEVFSDEESKLISDLNFTHSDDPMDDYSIALIKGNFATGGAFGARYIAIKKDGKWSILASFQDDPDCKILKENNVPTEIYSGSCYDRKSTTTNNKALITELTKLKTSLSFKNLNQIETYFKLPPNFAGEDTEFAFKHLNDIFINIDINDLEKQNSITTENISQDSCSYEYSVSVEDTMVNLKWGQDTNEAYYKKHPEKEYPDIPCFESDVLWRFDFKGDRLIFKDFNRAG
jgi:hypothetical protein